MPAYKTTHTAWHLMGAQHRLSNMQSHIYTHMLTLLPSVSAAASTVTPQAGVSPVPSTTSVFGNSNSNSSSAAAAAAAAAPAAAATAATATATAAQPAKCGSMRVPALQFASKFVNLLMTSVFAPHAPLLFDIRLPSSCCWAVAVWSFLCLFASLPVMFLQVTLSQTSALRVDIKASPATPPLGCRPCGSSDVDYLLPGAACVVLQVIHGVCEVWCFCYSSRSVSRVWQPPVSALLSMPAAFMLYISDFCYTACWLTAVGRGMHPTL